MQSDFLKSKDKQQSETAQSNQPLPSTRSTVTSNISEFWTKKVTKMKIPNKLLVGSLYGMLHPSTTQTTAWTQTQGAHSHTEAGWLRQAQKAGCFPAQHHVPRAGASQVAACQPRGIKCQELVTRTIQSQGNCSCVHSSTPHQRSNKHSPTHFQSQQRANLSASLS